MHPVVKIILAIILPPLAAFLQVGATKHFWINLVLLFLTFYVGALIHALWLVLSEQKAPAGAEPGEAV